MNLLDLQRSVNTALCSAIDKGEKPEDVIVSIQIDDEANPHHGYVCTDSSVELTYDGNCMASGCVIHGWRNTDKSPDQPKETE